MPYTLNTEFRAQFQHPKQLPNLNCNAQSTIDKYGLPCSRPRRPSIGIGKRNLMKLFPLQSLTKQTLTTLSLYTIIQVINKSTHKCGHIIDRVVVRPDDDIHKNLLLQTHLNQTIIALNPTSVFQSLSHLPNTRKLGTWLILTVHHSMLNFPVFQSFHLLKRRTSSVKFLRTVQDKHAPPSLQKVIKHNYFPLSESIRDVLYIARRERGQAEMKWRNAKLTIYKELYRKSKHKVSKLVHSAKCKSYTERIVLASSSKELHQIVNTLSNRHPPKIFPTI